MIDCSKYKFKNQENVNKWKEELSNIDENIKYIYRERKSLQPILTNYRRVFKITPKAIKENYENKFDSDRDFIVYILLNYTSCSIESITQELNYNLKSIEKIKDEKSLYEKYSKKTDKFFTPLKEGYLLDIYQKLCFKDEF